MISIPGAVNDVGFISAANWGRAVTAAWRRVLVSIQGLRNDATRSLCLLAALDEKRHLSLRDVRSARALAEHAAECFRQIEAEMMEGQPHGHH